jgi:hypothetical protein
MGRQRGSLRHADGANIGATLSLSHLKKSCLRTFETALDLIQLLRVYGLVDSEWRTSTRQFRARAK